MPIDAATAAIVGASVGAVGSTFGALVTAWVTRTNAYRQHLYVKRLEVYEAACTAVNRWLEQTTEERIESRDEIGLLLYFYGAAPIVAIFHRAFGAVDFFDAVKQHDNAPIRNEETEKILKLPSSRERRAAAWDYFEACRDELIEEVALDAQSSPARRLTRGVRTTKRLRAEADFRAKMKESMAKSRADRNGGS